MKALAIAVLVAITACGASAREKTLHATLLATDASRDAFIAYDERKQLDISHNAPTEVEGIAQLNSYHAKRDHVEAAFQGFYRAVAIATVLQHDGKSIAGVLAAYKILSDELKALTGKGLP